MIIRRYNTIYRIFWVVMLIMLCNTLLAKVYTPKEMPNVNVSNRYEYVSDPGGLLSADVKKAVNEQLWNVRQQTSCEVVVALPPDIGDETIEEWSEQLFTLWGIGKKDKDNGLLFVIAPEQRRARIEVGYGVEGVLPDISCANIINSAVIPNMKEGNLDAAVKDAVGLMVSALTDPAVAEELKSKESDNFSGVEEALSIEVLLDFVYVVATIIFIFTCVVFVRVIRKCRKRDSYSKATIWHEYLSSFFWCGVLSLGSGLVIWLLAYLLYRRNRVRRRRCTSCGHKMRRLNEEEDNTHLSSSQDFEEQLNTVDYDVWVCSECGCVECYPFKKEQNKYTECPSCHTIAMSLVCEKVIRPATTKSIGLGERVYECQYCHYQQRKQYTIPKKDEVNGGAIAAGAILGSMAGRGSGGGGSFGGGFGGGSTGGGGASGGW